MNNHSEEKSPNSIVKRILKVIKVLIIALLVIVGAFFLFVNLVNVPNKGRIDKMNREKCEKIIKGLSSYQQTTGRYPVNLEELIPEYLSKVPLETMHDGDTGRSFDYDVEDDGRIFRLRYNEAPIGSLPSDSYFEYKSDKGSWTQNYW